MRRRAFNWLALLSLVLCALCLMLCLASLFAGPGVRWHRTHATPQGAAHTIDYLVLVPGAVVLQRDTITAATQSNTGPQPRFAVGSFGPPRRSAIMAAPVFPGIRAGTLSVARIRRYQLAVSLWWPVVIFSLLPIWWAARRPARLRQWRQVHGLCLKCGYDLRASADKCPECGKPVPAKPAQPTRT
jgi:hypothetical protein